MHPEYLAVYAILQDRIRVADTKRRVRAARADRPPAATRRRRSRGSRRPLGSRAGEAA